MVIDSSAVTAVEAHYPYLSGHIFVRVANSRSGSVGSWTLCRLTFWQT